MARLAFGIIASTVAAGSVLAATQYVPAGTDATAGIVTINGSGSGSSLAGRLTPANTGAGGSTATAAVAAAPCVAGTWVTDPGNPDDPANSNMPIRLSTQHFTFRWNNGTNTTVAAAQSAANHLEYVWGRFINVIGFPEPDCGNTTKKRINVFIGQNYGLSGGPDGMYMGPGGLADRFGLAHEFTHTLQGKSLAFRDSPFSGWMWESHANWMTVQLPEFRTNTHCSVLAVDSPHMYYGSTRVRYCNWQFWEYLKDRFGYSVINDLWRNAPKPGQAGQTTADPFVQLMTNQGWSVSQLNDAFGDWALRNANWDYTNPDGTDQGAAFRASYGPYKDFDQNAPLRTTTLDPMDLARRRFKVEPTQAPQRWGYNIIRLYPDAGASSVTVTFRGVRQTASATSSFPGMRDEPTTMPAPNSDWRWGLVAVGSNGASRYSAMQRGSDNAVTFPVNSGDTALYMVVTGTPSQMTQIRWDQPYYSIYRYPYMVQFAGAMPQGYQPNAPAPVSGAKRHPNGGGWVGPNAVVASTAYVGPYAKVLGGTVSGNARVENHGLVLGGSMSGNAVLGALGIIQSNTSLADNAKVRTTFMGLGFYEQNIALTGTAQNIGDVEQRGASFNRGVYYGMVENWNATDASTGANRTTAVPEVTATPNFTWR